MIFGPIAKDWGTIMAPFLQFDRLAAPKVCFNIKSVQSVLTPQKVKTQCGITETRKSPTLSDIRYCTITTEYVYCSPNG